MFKKYQWNLLLIVLSVSMVGLILFDLVFYHSIKRYLFDLIFNEMRIKTELALSMFDEHRIGNLNECETACFEICYRIRRIVNARVTIIDSNGRVIADSDVAKDQVRQMDNHLSRPEIQQAKETGIGQSYRMSDTVHRKIFYTAFPIKFQGKLSGFLRLAYYDQRFEESLSNIVTLIVAANIVGLIILVLLSYFFSRVAAAPITSILKVAQKIANGDLERSFPIGRVDEIGTLSLIFNDLTDKLKNQIRQISHERSKLEDILSNLDAGIIVLDHQKHIIHANPRIFQMMKFDYASIDHKNLLEIIRDEPLIVAVDQAMKEKTKIAGEFERLVDQQKVFFSYIVTPFWLAELGDNGALVQLYDITAVKKLEAIRRDFVANASHEFKTPLTSIVGYTETLLEGAVENRSDRIRFLRRIREQAQRLEFLVSDLLKLSELEREQPLELKPTDLSAIIKDIVDDFKTSAQQKNIELTFDVPPQVRVLANEDGIRSVLNNLVDNAIKYTLPEGKIQVRVSNTGTNKIKVAVIDNGIGIDPKYHDRIFQRFYRIDKARSQALGGSGLGLAIVKHIVERHGSKIYIESALGKGSTFWFELKKVES
ncbi:MAG: ATP-binding protein [candidate division KSB1 bacterium]|nr:ATP-binding protein [candidate division KSB1 bacterium]MDZ7336430.1 ATP-binding protein [candidate division KSB1 bacterium]MDZ7357159.1 ATP-binding protein [candidate division KSB1 bacterium]MDZ7376938.1 ATP-binding protein [candidate division KSB1 bacterium]MDZ7400227.1 ATP-binding protein [candidate division KSB1 bacterium]